MLWRKNALQLESWDRVAWIAMHAVAPYMKAQARIEDFQPLRGPERQTSLTAFLNFCEQMKGKLPAKLTEEEKEARWRRFLKEQS